MEEIGMIPVQVSDPAVAMAKLAWWHQELQAAGIAKSEHPVIRSLVMTTGISGRDSRLLGEYLGGVAGLSAGDALASMQDLESVALQIGGSEASLLAGLGKPDTSDERPGVRSIGAAHFLHSLIMEPESRLSGQSWWLPLDLQARFGVGTADLDKGDAANRLSLALREVSTHALNAVNKGRDELLTSGGSQLLSAGEHHLVVTSRLLKSRLATARDVSAGSTMQAFGGAKEVFSAWREAVRTRS